MNNEITETNYFDIGNECPPVKRTCAYCGKEYLKNAAYIDYKVSNKHFCSFNHKMKYIKENNIDTRKKYSN